MYTHAIRLPKVSDVTYKFINLHLIQGVEKSDDSILQLDINYQNFLHNIVHSKKSHKNKEIYIETVYLEYIAHRMSLLDKINKTFTEKVGKI